MIRLVFILVIVGIALWWMFGRRRAGDSDKTAADAEPGKPAVPQAMVACAHCGVHLPQAEALADAQGRLFCGEAHRLAGPR